jgi:hypothetical protein
MLLVCMHPLFQRSSRHTTEIHVQYSTASLTVWLCRICLRHKGCFDQDLWFQGPS